jgi:hypothetical protein
VAPLLGFSSEVLPIELAPDLTIDTLSDDEVNRCVKIGLLGSIFLDFALLAAKDTVGLRVRTSVKKIISDGTEPPASGTAVDPGLFGRRPPLYASQLVDDVLVALRLFKSGNVSSPGSITFCDAWSVASSMGFNFRPSKRPHLGKYSLNQEEVDQLREIWSALTGGLLEQKAFLESSLRRFNFAGDRFRPDDELVDLLIAAESLLLTDASPAELQFRLALRAAKFVEHPELSPQDVYELMKKAYNVRSEIVHTGKVSNKTLNSLPQNSLNAFADDVEEIIRLALRKAINVASTEQDFGKSTYWDNLLFTI